MPTFDAEPERVTVFPIDEEYWFSHYFERTAVFERLSDYYNDEAYRFEIPADEFDAVREALAAEHVELEVAEDLERYCVVKDPYDEYADTLRESVAHWERAGHRFFLMQDQQAVRAAVERGATPLAETDLVLGL